MWGVDLTQENRRFLEGFDPQFFTYVCDTHVSQLEGEHRQRAALAIRLNYAHAVETLFALLGAAIQAPNCPLGWLLMYDNRRLASLVGKVSSGSPVLSRLISTPVSWSSLSYDIHAFTHSDPQEDRRIKTLFGASWELMALELVDQMAVAEYNSIKHGFRIRSGGSSVQIGTRSTDETPIIDSRSEFGSRFFLRHQLSPKWVDFAAEPGMRNWAPLSLAVKTELAALSIGNVLAYLKTRLGSSAESVTFNWPLDSASLKLAWESEFVIESMRGGFVVRAEHIEPKLKETILEAYAAGD